MRHRRLYVLPEYYRDDEGVIPNAFVCTIDDSEEVRVLTTSGADLKVLTDEMNTCQTVVPSADTFLEMLLAINLDLDLYDDFGYTIEGVYERGCYFGYKGTLRDTATIMGIEYPESIWRDASFFREPGSLGRHLPKEDEELFRRVIDHDKEVLRAMREIDRRIVHEEEEYYRIFEMGRIGSTSERSFLWQKSQMAQENLFSIRRQIGPERPDDLRLKVSVPFVPIPSEEWQERYYRALYSVACGALCYENKAVRLGDKLPVCYSRERSRIEVYPEWCAPIIYHLAKPKEDGGIWALRKGKDGEPMMMAEISKADAVLDLVDALQSAKLRGLMSIPGLATGVTKIIEVTRASVELLVKWDCTVITKSLLDTYEYKYEIVTK